MLALTGTSGSQVATPGRREPSVDNFPWCEEARHVWKESGGIAAALNMIRVEELNRQTPEIYFFAAHSIAHLYTEEGAAEAFARENNVRAMLRLYGVPTNIRGGAEAVDKAFLSCLSVCPEALPQYIAAFSDPDPEVVFAALLTMEPVLMIGPDTRKRLIQDESFKAALFAQLSHPNLYCRSATMTALVYLGIYVKDNGFLTGANLPEVLVGCLRDGRLPEPPPPPADSIFSWRSMAIRDLNGRTRLARLTQPALLAAAGMVGLALRHPAIALQLAHTPNIAHMLVSCFKQFADLEGTQVEFLICMHELLAENGSAPKKVLAAELKEAGFLKMLPRLIRTEPELDTQYAIELVMDLISGIGGPAFPQPISREIIAALLRYIEAEGAHIGRAASALTALSMCQGHDPMFGVTSTNPKALVKNLARLMIKGNPTQAVSAHVLIMTHVRKDGGKELLQIAVDAGFVPGSMSLLGEEKKDFFTRGYGMQPAPHVWDRLREGLLRVIALGDRKYIMHAVKCGVSAVALEAIRKCTCESQLFGVQLVTKLTEHPDALKEMRRIGLWPGGFLEISGSRIPAVLEEYIGGLCGIVDRSPELATELMAGDIIAGTDCINSLKAFVRTHPDLFKLKVKRGLKALEWWAEENKSAIMRCAKQMRQARPQEVRCPRTSAFSLTESL
jgi:hypothetical protein